MTPNAVTQFQGNQPLQRGRKIEGVGKWCDFRLKLPYISETVRVLRDMPMVTMERFQEIIGGESIRVGSDDLE